MNKKAILFTFMSIMIAALLSTLYSTHEITPLDYDVRAAEMKADYVNNQMRSLISYTKASLKSSGYWTLNEMINNIYSSGNYYIDVQDVSNTFENGILNATIRGNKKTALENRTLDYLMGKIKNLTNNNLPVNTNYKLHNISLDQTKPFAVTTEAKLSLEIVHQDIIINDTYTIIVDIPITNLRDPLYKDIDHESRFEQTLTKGEFNASEFEKFVMDNEYKVPLPRSDYIGGLRPYSFFGRLTNNPNVRSNSNLVLISIVNPDDIPGPLPTNSSYVDYLFNYEISGFQCSDILRRVIGDASGARVDIEHLTLDFKVPSDIREPVTC